MHITKKLNKVLFLLLFCLILLSNCVKTNTCEDYKNQLNLLKGINWYSADFTRNNLGLHFGKVSSTIFHPKPFRQGSIEILGDMIKFTPTSHFKSKHKIEYIQIIKHCSGKLVLKFEDGLIFQYYSLNEVVACL